MASTVPTELAELIRVNVRALVDYPEEASVILSLCTGAAIKATIDCHEDDKCRVIGKKGNIINAIRTVFHCCAAKHGLKTSVSIRD